jgi:xanthine dehydrogenase small subunit
MAATPKRAAAVERQLVGTLQHDSGAWKMAAERVAEDFTPLTDVRGSSKYRMGVARNILIKALAEIAGVSSPTTRILDRQETVHVAD